ncbi:serine hydrolase domain-containing protein [Gellertiella hungarica]|uniref:CubicO group peptidase (Beta-lactamase class C family) n=1 Tax=Gellertiella hungarica TaxID=1572859 RepID=A0A7W6J6Y5_9HYPH|nr:serine hydrolase domain-containing protein [Gellertiella hungarica]MBB4065914.1 CubicO group peptidase (beta-lactamase class C family) [Gellertiella hungarica]
MRMQRVLALVATMLAAGAAMAEDPEIGAVDEAVEPYLGKDTPGLGVLVMRDGEIIHLKGYGYADIAAETPVTRDSLFDLASVSKQMTAQAAMLQIEDGLYTPETEIATILPAFEDQPGEERALTVSDIVHHVSGLADYLDGNEELNYGAETTNAQVIEWLARQPLLRPPGTKFDYSNSGYLTLGSLVAAADGKKSLDDVLEERIFKPLGMTSSGLVTSSRIDENRQVTGYSGTGGKFDESYSPTVTEGDGNVITSLADLAKYEKALATNALLSEEATDKLFENGTYDDGSAIEEDGEGYGYGWSIATGKQNYATHSGSWMGTSTYYQRNLTSGVTVILLANGEDISLGDLAAEVEQAAGEE